MAKERDNLLDSLLHAVKFPEGRIDLDDLIGEDATEAGILAGIDEFRFADGHEHALGGRGVGGGVRFTQLQIFLKRHLFLLGFFVTCSVVIEDTHVDHLAWLAVIP